MLCPDHKGYQAKRKPRSSCLSCWEIYWWKHPDEPVMGKDIWQLIGAIRTVERKVINQNLYGPAIIEE
jgi:hypothetical protein